VQPPKPKASIHGTAAIRVRECQERVDTEFENFGVVTYHEDDFLKALFDLLSGSRFYRFFGSR